MRKDQRESNHFPGKKLALQQTGASVCSISIDPFSGIPTHLIFLSDTTTVDRPATNLTRKFLCPLSRRAVTYFLITRFSKPKVVRCCASIDCCRCCLYSTIPWFNSLHQNHINKRDIFFHESWSINKSTKPGLPTTRQRGKIGENGTRWKATMPTILKDSFNSTGPCFCGWTLAGWQLKKRRNVVKKKRGKPFVFILRLYSVDNIYDIQLSIL